MLRTPPRATRQTANESATLASIGRDAAGNVYAPVRRTTRPGKRRSVVGSRTVPADRDWRASLDLAPPVEKRIPRVGGDPPLCLRSHPCVHVAALEGRRCHRGRAALRWHGRLCHEVDVTLDEAQAVLAALVLLAGARKRNAAFALAELLTWRGLERPCETLVAWARDA